MKKKLFLGMAALLGMSLAFTACSNDDDPAGAAVNDNAIGFSVLTNNAAGTRATAITAANANDQMESMLVWGTYNGDDTKYYFGTTDKGIQFNNNAGTWDYAQSTDLHYWPSEALNFYAVSPISGDGLSITNTTISYTIPTDQKNQVDLMYAYTTNQTKPASGKAALQFKHLLSQVLFKAKSVSSTLQVEINSITIHNVVNNFEYDNINTSSAAEGRPATNARSTYAVGLASAVTVPTDGTAVDATDADGVLILRPQTLIPFTSKEDFENLSKTYIEVEAKIKSGDSYLLGTASTYGTTYIGLGSTWEAGKKYIYTLVFGGENGGGVDPNGDPTLTPIGFTVTVADWTDAWKEGAAEGDINL